MRQRRSNLEIYFKILGRLSKGQLPITQIMYKTGVSYQQAKRYLDFLIDEGVVDKVEDAGKSVYRITEKGKRILMHFRSIEEELLTRQRVWFRM